MVEDLQRGDIPKEYRMVKIVVYQPEIILEVAGTPGIRQEYTIVEDEEGIRYQVDMKVGEVGDTFKMDVSMLNELD